MTIIPILLYHSVSADPPEWIAPYSVTPDSFAHHADLIVASGRTPMTVSELVAALRGHSALPPRPVVVTFDDGFADVVQAANRLLDNDIRSTLYVTTGALSGGPRRPKHLALPPADMLDWSQLTELTDMDVEIGAHTLTHPQLDAMRIDLARNEIQGSKHLLEDYLGREVPSFAYPHGFQSARLRSEVATAGYTSACGVMNALSSDSDRVFCLARLTVRNTTPAQQVAAWLEDRDARVAPFPEALRTKLWRAYRRGRGTRSTRGVIKTSARQTEHVGKAGELRADVIICTYTKDRWELLTRAVRSVLNQRVTPAQLIIVVDHNHGLAGRCRQEWETTSADSRVPIVIAENQFAGRLGSARNTGLSLASADIVAFLDDDAEAAENWLERLLAVYESHPEAVAVGGAPQPNYAAPRPRWFPPDFDWVFGCDFRTMPRQLAPARHLIGASMSVRRDPMLDIGGFHADDHDDMDLSHRVAHAHGRSAVLYEPRAKVYHYVTPERLTWTYFWRRCFFVNRSKVAAFADMGEAGNLGAELRFARDVASEIGPALVAAATGRTERLHQWLASVAGLSLAGTGYLIGRAQLARGVRPKVLTTGLCPDDVNRARIAALVADDA